MASIKINKNAAGDIVSYRLRADLGRDPSGKQIVKTMTIKRDPSITPARELKLIRRKAEDWEMGLRAGTIRAGKFSYDNFVKNIFFPLHVQSGELKATTIEFYRNISRRSLEYFSKIQITDIRSADIQKYLKHLHQIEGQNGKPLSQTTIKHEFNFLKNVFNFAETHDYISVNPMRKVPPPHKERKQIEYFTADQAEAFLTALELAEPKWRTIINVLLRTGLRRGEAAAIKWKDIDFEKRQIRISKNAIYTPTTGILVTSAKTKTSERTVPISSRLLEILSEWREEQQRALGGSGISLSQNFFVFANENNPLEPIRPDSITRAVKRLVASVGLPDMSPHDLRHTAATLLLEAGTDVKSVGAILGHKDARTTLDFYVGVQQEKLQDASERLDRVLELAR